MKLWTWIRNAYICKHCGVYNEYMNKCDRCGYKSSVLEIEHLENSKKIIKRTLHITGCFKINPFYIKTVVKPARLETWYSYRNLCDDYNKYRRKKMEAYSCGSGLINHYQIICKSIITQLRAIHCGRFPEYINNIKEYSKDLRKEKNKRDIKYFEDRVERIKMSKKVEFDEEIGE